MSRVHFLANAGQQEAHCASLRAVLVGVTFAVATADEQLTCEIHAPPRGVRMPRSSRDVMQQESTWVNTDRAIKGRLTTSIAKN